MAKKGKLRSIHIEPAANGYTVRAHHDLAPGNGPGPQGMGMDPAQPSVFAKKKHVLDHVSSLMDDDGDEGSQPVVPATHPVKKLQRSRY